METEIQEKVAPESEAVQETTEDKPITTVDAANRAIDALKSENDRTEALASRLENARAEQILGGKADAGQAPEKPKEETPAEYTARLMRGDVKDGEGRQD